MIGAAALLSALTLGAAALLAGQAPDGGPQARPPNIVLIVVDDLGYGDLGCYGQERIATPHLDRLAADGRRYTQFYAGSTVCAPSRCSLMTGLHTGHAFIRGNGKDNLLPEHVTLAEVLRGAGYRTAMVGKWGIGHEGSAGVPTRQGFDSFFGYLDQHHAHNHWPSFLVRDEERVQLPNVVPGEGPYGQGVATEKGAYSHDLMTAEALAFLERAPADEPFLLYLAWTLPHANNEAGRAGMEVPEPGEYADEPWPEPERGFAAMVARIDRDLGRLRAVLEERELAGDTLVLFTSDNGPHSEGGHRADFFRSSGDLSGIKRSLTEGGIRVPLIAWGPGRVPAGTSSEHVAAFWDLMPTFAALAGADEELPAELDGLSFAPSLAGDERAQSAPGDLYWAFYEGGSGRALRRGDWKLIQQPYLSQPRLYDLAADPGEARDLADELPELVEELVGAMDAADRPVERWRFPER